MRTALSVAFALLVAAAYPPPALAAAASSPKGFQDFNALTGEGPVPSVSPALTNSAPPGSADQTPSPLSSSALPAADSTNSPATLSGYVADDKYKLRVGDKISLQIQEDRDAPKSLVIADSGELDAPYVGRVAAADKTCKQLADELKTQLEKEYYYRATVIIALDVANKLLGRVYVWGQVHTQGPLDINVNENLTVGKAILRAGGFGDFANKKRVQVIRGAAGRPAGKQTFVLNMIEILEKGKTEKDIILEPDDSIIVPEKTFNL
jgi:polysaccharide export outer membrane protein